MHPFVHISMAPTLVCSYALAAAPDYMEDSAVYTDFSECKVPEKIL